MDTTAHSDQEVPSEHRFRQLLEAAPDAILEVDQHGKIVLVNQAAESSFGYAREELLGQPVELLVPEVAREKHAQLRQGYQNSPSMRPMGVGRELQARRKDGTAFPVEISLSPVFLGGEHHVTAIVRDVSERQRAQDRVKEIQTEYALEAARTNTELAARNAEIERANRLKSEFLATMSHELRTPLHTIIGFSELLGEGLDGELNATQRRFVEHIHRDSLHLLELINDILDLSKIEAGRLDLHCAPMPLEEALQEVLATIRPQAAAKSQRLRVSTPEGLSLDADRVRFKEILYNLLSNAVKFTGEGGTIQITVARQADFAMIEVEDTGIGIAPEHRSAVFDAFRQVGPTTKGVREGTGLGLAIARHLVEQHGGCLLLTSELGRGSSFRFTIPLEPQQRAPRERALVLLVHEQRAALDDLVTPLMGAGFQVTIASQKRDVLLRMERLDPDCIACGPGFDDALALRTDSPAIFLLKLPIQPDAAQVLVELQSVRRS